MNQPTLMYYGQISCQAHKRDGNICDNRAYYSQHGQYLCGVHSKGSTRQQLPHNPNQHQLKLAQIRDNNQIAQQSALDNRTQCLKGSVTCYHMRMMKPVDTKSGYLNVFPNFKHGSRTDGLGMSSLSPMSMGPIEHKQIGLPPATNLENFHQANKCFPDEVDSHGQPNEQFYQTRLTMYQDPIVHRHKQSSNHKNVPLFSVWINDSGQQLHLTYIQSRQIYCHFYQHFALQSPDYHKLTQLINDGYNLQICGYDAYVPTESLDQHYLDPSRPFGHEMVLYTLLTVQDDTQYPWRKYQTLSFE